MSRSSRRYDALAAFESEACTVELLGLSKSRRHQASSLAQQQGLQRAERWKYTPWHKHWPRTTQWNENPSQHEDEGNDSQASTTHQSYASSNQQDATIPTIDEEGVYTIHTLNGRVHVPSSAQQQQLAQAGISIYSLADHAQNPNTLTHSIQDQITQHLTHIAQEDGFTLTALNTARTTDVCVIHVASTKNNSSAESVVPTLHIQHIHQPDHAQQVVYQRVLLMIEADASCTLLETFNNQSSGLCNHVIEIHAQNNAQIHYTRVQSEALMRHHIGRVAIQAQAESHVQAHFLNLGSKLARLDLDVDLLESKAQVDLYGLFTGSDTQHLDQQIAMKHQAAHCQSSQEFKGILNHQSCGIFTGKVYVAPGAHHTQAQQNNPNLLLSTEAKAVACPQLEIYNDEVECSHGATVGQLDPYALFYLQTRGIKREQAIQMLTQAFASQIKKRVAEHVHPLIDQAITRTLHEKI